MKMKRAGPSLISVLNPETGISLMKMEHSTAPYEIQEKVSRQKLSIRIMWSHYEEEEEEKGEETNKILHTTTTTTYTEKMREEKHEKRRQQYWPPSTGTK
uniref:Uncharacterized protein n=1 Tax=Cacopsylla melanoneura TaxID=428564 RepID=A0A8D8RFG0_9HEMI